MERGIADSISRSCRRSWRRGGIRLEVRCRSSPLHKFLFGFGTVFASGYVENVLVGAMLEEPIKENTDMKMKGSFFVAVGETKEEVIEELRRDVYSTGGVWDWEKVEVIPVSGLVDRW